VRFDPEDYAFIARYDPGRLSGEVKGLGKQGVMRLLFLGIAVVIVIYIWSQLGKPGPSTWFSTTQIAAACWLVAMILAVIVMLVERSKLAVHLVNLVMLVTLLVASCLLLIPVWMLIRQLGGFADTVRSFVGVLQALPGQPGVDAVNSLLTSLDVTRLVLLVVWGIAVAFMVITIAAALMWLMTPRSLGWLHRKAVVVAVWFPAILLLVCSAGLIFVSKFLLPNVEKKLGVDNVPVDTILPSAAILDDWLIWLLLAGLLITLGTFMASAAKLTTGAALLSRFPQGNALRVDALGVVLDDAKLGPQRVTWPAIGAIAGRARSALPGPELVIGRPGQPAWAVPFMFLDVMPGTIDSAIRANTSDARDIDLTPLDRVF